MPSSDIEAAYPVTVMRADAFDTEITGVFDAAKSLASALPNEAGRESILLRDAVNRLNAAKLLRKNPRLYARRRSALDYASEVLARRHV